MKNRITGYVLIILAAICFRSAQEKAVLLSIERQALGISTYSTIENAPPSMALATMMLGGFRGVIADVLWLRINYLQEMGQYFEIATLADWITRLEPGNSAVWGYHAWNMSYNISVIMGNPEDRWRWVQNGISLLRNEGMRYNANDAELHFDLGWIFEDKIGGKTDQMHMFYKKKLASIAQEYFGDSPKDTMNLIGDEARASRIKADLVMDPLIITELTYKYGNIDWRLPSAHALYWAYKGRRNARDLSLFRCNHMITRSLTDLFIKGTLLYDKSADIYQTSPCTSIFDACIREYEEILQKNKDELLLTSFKSILVYGMLVFEKTGDSVRARNAYAKLCSIDKSISGSYEQFINDISVNDSKMLK